MTSYDIEQLIDKVQEKAEERELIGDIKTFELLDTTAHTMRQLLALNDRLKYALKKANKRIRDGGL